MCAGGGSTTVVMVLLMGVGGGMVRMGGFWVGIRVLVGTVVILVLLVTEAGFRRHDTWIRYGSEDVLIRGKW